MQLVPKSPLFAVKLSHDLVAKRGQWVIGFASDEIQVLDHAEVARCYADIAPELSLDDDLPGGTYGKCVTQQGLRVIVALAKLGGTGIARDLRRYLDFADFGGISQRLNHAMVLGLATRELPAGVKRGFLWTLTQDGWQMVEQEKLKPIGNSACIGYR